MGVGPFRAEVVLAATLAFVAEPAREAIAAAIWRKAGLRHVGRLVCSCLRRGPVAQWLEPAAHNGLVVGSSPTGPTNLSLG